MKTYDNSGNLGCELTTSYVDGKAVTVMTSYSNYGGNQRVLAQHVDVIDHNDQSKGFSKSIFGGKILP